MHYIEYLKNKPPKWRAKKLPQAGSIRVFNRSIVSELWRVQIVGGNISTEPSCELSVSSYQNILPGGSSIAASFSQNSLPGGYYMEVNTDMKKPLR